MPTPIVSAYGIQVQVPQGWNAEIFRYGDGSPADGPGPHIMSQEERDNSPPLMHAATVELPPNRGTYALAVIDSLQPGDAFAVLIDHGESEASEPVFSMRKAPWPLTPDNFDPTVTPRMAPGVSFVQRFFQLEGRAFVLFAGVNGGNGLSLPVGKVNQLLAGVVIGHR